jgi:hypothetical protein
MYPIRYGLEYQCFYISTDMKNECQISTKGCTWPSKHAIKTVEDPGDRASSAALARTSQVLILEAP